MAIPIPSQFRAARAWLGWSPGEAAVKASVSVVTIHTAEGTARGRPVDGGGLRIRAVFEAAGVSFTKDRDGTGVKLWRW